MQPRRLEIVVLGGDEHVERIGGRLDLPKRLPRPLRNRRLQEGRLREVVDDERPGLAAGKAGRQGAQQLAPKARVLRRLVLAPGQQGHRADLGEETVQRVALVGAQSRQRHHVVRCEQGQELGNVGLTRPFTAAHTDELFCQQRCRHDHSLNNPDALKYR